MAVQKIKKGDTVSNKYGDRIVITRTSTDEDGFLVVYFEFGGEERSCFAVDCDKVE